MQRPESGNERAGERKVEHLAIFIYLVRSRICFERGFFFFAAARFVLRYSALFIVLLFSGRRFYLLSLQSAARIKFV